MYISYYIYLVLHFHFGKYFMISFLYVLCMPRMLKVLTRKYKFIRINQSNQVYNLIFIKVLYIK